MKIWLPEEVEDSGWGRDPERQEEIKRRRWRGLRHVQKEGDVKARRGHFEKDKGEGRPRNRAVERGRLCVLGWVGRWMGEWRKMQ